METCNFISITLLVIVGLLLLLVQERSLARKKKIAWILGIYPATYLRHVSNETLNELNTLVLEYSDSPFYRDVRREFNRRRDNNLDKKVE